MKVLQQSLGETQSKDVKDTSKSPLELLMEPRAKVEPGSGKHSVSTHFPKDPNCDIWLKTKITRASCRRRAGAVVPKAENFVDLITADHKVLSEGSESRNNHRYAVVVQDFGNSVVTILPRAKEKLARRSRSAYRSSWSRQGKPKIIYMTHF